MFKSHFNLFRQTTFVLISFSLWFFKSEAFGQSAPFTSKQSFDANWKFEKSDFFNAESVVFNDKAWRTIDLPHDWSIEDLQGSAGDSIIGPFSKKSESAGATGYVMGGTGWYRKHFTLKPGEAGKQISILFDGVYMNSDVWINGKHLGNHPYGYTPFYYDLTNFLNPAGKDNVIAVKVKNLGVNSRWYSGSGIYRHVWMMMKNKIDFTEWGTFVTSPKVDKSLSTVQFQTEVENVSREIKNAVIGFTIFSTKGGKVVSGKINTKLNASGKTVLTKALNVARPDLWSPKSPHLYKADITIEINGKLISRKQLTFGIREISVDATYGLRINGEKLLLKGGGVHHDNGALGAVTIDRAEERKVEQLKANGFNAIRTTHNPPSEQFLNACDKLGMVVIDEAFDTWQHPKNKADYHLYFKEWWKKDLRSIVLRDRNHPSVIFWSIGNEINERAETDGVDLATQMVSLVKSIDPTRKVTEGVCGFWDHPGVEWDHSANAFKPLDVAGSNYEWKNYESDHQKYPERIMMGTESFAYEAAENWSQVEKHPYVIGDFVWTAMDYMGEAAIGHNDLDSVKPMPASMWPAYYISNCGDLDVTGIKRPQSYFRDVVWDRSVIEMAVHAPVPAGHKDVFSAWGWPDEYRSWNWEGNEGKELEITVYSKCDKVRLELNGKTLAEKQVSDPAKLAFKFNVPYNPGEIKAFAITNNEVVGATSLKTVGKPFKLRLTADRRRIDNSRNDLSYISVEVLDENDQLVPDAVMPVNFSISGAAEIAAIGNGNPKGMQSFRQLNHDTYQGRCLVIVRPVGKSGAVNLLTNARGLQPGKLEIRVQ
ncbi:DUF4982 domain-containing protein [Pedobacter sp. HMF7647]|uniref:DUF4982 domain-containing protein n=1 Tax=Hufsiella arboris TaxID=2695275 RepID=A0A7K1YCU1_9SPHI|nr:glycoside hydrolase family 2 TIM barrel-domain containing protein [Hufsiella arboris]MXV52250.1 DUF4982 domain-containing protein [Hufsiella arboris]